MLLRVLAFRLPCLLLFASLASGCGPSEEDLAARVAAAAAATVAAAPTVTPYPTYTPAPTVTPYPTLTPAPTATPYPTYTPLPPTPTAVPAACPSWDVEVLAASPATEFDRFYLDSDSTHRMIVLSLAFSCQGTASVEFFPESVTLVHVGDEMRGWAQTPALFQSDTFGWGDVIDLTESAVYFTFSEPNDTETATLVYEWPEEYTDFILLFPGSPPLPVSVD